jgi:hypothetical protein
MSLRKINRALGTKRGDKGNEPDCNEPMTRLNSVETRRRANSKEITEAPVVSRRPSEGFIVTRHGSHAGSGTETKFRGTSFAGVPIAFRDCDRHFLRRAAELPRTSQLREGG